MTGLTRFRFGLVLFLALGVLALSSTPALSNLDIVSQQIVPDSDGGLWLVGTGGGHPGPDRIVQEPREPAAVSTEAGFLEVLEILRDRLKSIWLTTWKAGILP